MHQLIRIITIADDEEHATGIARALFEGMYAELNPPYDYGKTMDEGGRWSDQMPDVVQETGSIEADTEFALEQMDNAWESTCEEFNRKIAILQAALEETEDTEALMESPTVETEVEPWNPLGLAQDEDDHTDTYSSDFRYACNCIGEYSGPSHYLYNEYGTAIRRPSRYEELREEITDGEETYYLVPIDVHY